MSNIKIICDTLNDVSQDIMKRYNIDMLPATIIFEGTEYKAGVDIDSDEFYKMLRSSNTIPSTSQITYATFKEIFEKYTDEGNIVLYMAGSSVASGTYQSAMLAKRDMQDKPVYIFDTYNLCIGGGMLIEEAGKMCCDNMDINEILTKLEEYKNKVEVFFSVDSLDYLHKGGRISGTKAAIGTLLNIKPILKLEDGLVKQKSQVRGSKKIMPSLMEHLKNAVGEDFSKKTIYVGCGDDTKSRDIFIEKVKNELNPKEVCIFQIGPCVGTHSGPSVLGIACLNSEC